MSRACCIGLESGIRRRQRFWRRALNLAMAIRVNDVALEHHFDGHSTARLVGVQRCGQRQVTVLSKGMGRGLTTFRTLSGGGQRRLLVVCCLFVVCFRVKRLAASVQRHTSLNRVGPRHRAS